MMHVAVWDDETPAEHGLTHAKSSYDSRYIHYALSLLNAEPAKADRKKNVKVCNRPATRKSGSAEMTKTLHFLQERPSFNRTAVS